MRFFLIFECLFLSIIFAAQADETETLPPNGVTKSTTTAKPEAPKDPNDKENDEINQKIRHMIDISKTGNYVGNKEFDRQLTLLRVAEGLDASSLRLKLHAYDQFLSYNALRLRLEGEVSNRIAVLENLLQNDNISGDCVLYYIKQKSELTKALTETNDLKIFKLEINKENCANEEEKDESDSSSEYDWSWPGIFG